MYIFYKLTNIDLYKTIISYRNINYYSHNILYSLVYIIL